ncbi:MAG: erg26, C-3 sterol dehydrogenase [Stictis urceolatum]|nr:erg26, C-3 sterol dehydrogenase [Stictis urceolata]
MASSEPTTILVTGGAGFVGSAILQCLHIAHPSWPLFSFDHKPASAPIPGVTYLSGSVTLPSDISSALQTSLPTAIIHTAGIVPSVGTRYTRKSQQAVFATNIDGTKNILSAAQLQPSCRAFVYTSSICAVTDNFSNSYANINETHPTSPRNSLIYGESKALTEPHVLAADSPSAGFRTCALRPSVIFGPEDCQLLPSIHACIAKRETPFIIGDGLNLWDITHVRNVAHAHRLAAENLLSGTPTAGGEAFFIANETPVPFRDICRQVWKLFGHFPPFEVRVAEGLARAVAGVADFLGGWLGMPVTLSSGSVGDAVAVRYCDGEKARRVLGYRPIVGLEEGLRESCEALKRRLEGKENVNGYANGNVDGYANGNLNGFADGKRSNGKAE